MFYEVDFDEIEDKPQETVQNDQNQGWTMSWSGLVSAVKKTSVQVKDIVVNGSKI
jgi:hypothetical protein